MQLSDLIAEARERTRDINAPYSCSDERFTRFANEAQREACRRARLLVDSSSADVCVISLQANTSVYALDRRILFVRRATIDGQSRPLVRIHVSDLDSRGSEWQTETGDVDGWVVGMDTQALRLFRVPTVDGTARLTVQRLPLDDMSADTDVPEISERYHEKLVEWMVYRYFMTPDEEMRDPTAAQAAITAFESEFGPAQPAIEEAWAQEHYGFDNDGNVYS